MRRNGTVNTRKAPAAAGPPRDRGARRTIPRLIRAAMAAGIGLTTAGGLAVAAGVYVPFADIGGAVLRMLAATRDITISAPDGAELTDRFATMPPHPEVPGALRRLRDHMRAAQRNGISANIRVWRHQP